MKHLLIIFIITLTFSTTYAQPKDGKIVMSYEQFSNNRDLNDILIFEKIDFYKLRFTGVDLVGKHYLMTVKEIWNGEVTNIDTIINSATNKRLIPLNKDELELRVIGKKTHDNKLKMTFRFPWVGIERKYDATSSEDYSLRDVGADLNIEPAKSFYTFAYILPYEKDGWKMWCAVDQSGSDIESWGKEFGLEHYLVIEMKFE